MDIMVFTVLSSALFLVSLLPLCTQSVDNEVEQNTLFRIIEFFHNFKKGQFAAAINVPKNHCGEGFIPSTSPDFLIEDKNNDVKNIISADKNPVYKGKKLIAAGVQKTDPAHSEFLLMNPQNNSPLTDLLKNENDGCVVFYTLNSPCMKTCLNGNYNIIGGLDELKAYNGIKAFAFQKIWRYDKDRQNELREQLKLIAIRIPLYRCDEHACTLCGKPGPSVEIIEACLTV